MKLDLKKVAYSDISLSKLAQHPMRVGELTTWVPPKRFIAEIKKVSLTPSDKKDQD